MRVRWALAMAAGLALAAGAASAVLLPAEYAALRLSRAPLPERIALLAGAEIARPASLRGQSLLLMACDEALRGPHAALQPAAARTRIAGHCLGLADGILARAPTLSLAHLVRAGALHATAAPGFAEALHLSQATGPAEGWIAQRRFDLAARGHAALDAPARAAFAQDAALLIAGGAGRELVAARYLRHPEIREAVTAAAETLPAALQRGFLAEVETGARR